MDRLTLIQQLNSLGVAAKPDPLSNSNVEMPSGAICDAVDFTVEPVYWMGDVQIDKPCLVYKGAAELSAVFWPLEPRFVCVLIGAFFALKRNVEYFADEAEAVAYAHRQNQNYASVYTSEDEYRNDFNAPRYAVMPENEARMNFPDAFV